MPHTNGFHTSTCLPARTRSRPALWLALIAGVVFAAPLSGSAQETTARPLITQPVDQNNLTVLRGNNYPLARPQFDRGPAPASLPMNRMLLVLKRSPEQAVALATLLDQQQEKTSPNYHHWLTPEQFGQEFGLAEQDIQTITAWLESQGFQIDRVASGRGIIEFSGDAGQVQQTFHTAIHKYVVNGQSHWANAADPGIPAALAPAVAGIASLNNFPRKPMHVVAGIFQRSRTTGKLTALQPMATFGCTSPLPGSPSNCYALSPYDFNTIYNVLPVWSAGTYGNQGIAIVARSDINLQDVSNFRRMFGLAPQSPAIVHTGPDPGILSATGDETESVADVEWAGVAARDAGIDLVVAESTEASDGVDLSAEYIVDNDLAPILSDSYGLCEMDLGTAGNTFYDQLWEQAAAEGITVLEASGDGASAVCDVGDTGATNGLSVNGLASTPYNVAVGGTDFDDASNPTQYWRSTNDPATMESAKSYIPETAWDDACTNPEVPTLFGVSGNAETICNNAALTSQYPFLLDVMGGSGGASTCTTSSGTATSCSGGYPQPTWQSGAGVPNNGRRNLPDVSLFAGDVMNGNFYLVCQSDLRAYCNTSQPTVLGLGGTSVSAQALAGVMSLVDQATGTRQGDANYVFYPLAAQAGASCNSSGTLTGSCVFYDTTSGTNAMPCITGSMNCVTNASGDKYGVLSGYAATSGYDLATGLGSINVANLVNNWKSATFQPSSTTLTLDGGSSVSITHGSPVSVSVAVSPASPVPTGDVSLLAAVNGQTVNAGTFTLANGSFSGSTTLLPGGSSYTVVAHYAGNGTYAASDSNAVSATVNPEPSRTFANLVTFDSKGNLTSYSASSITYGSGYYLLRVDVGDSSATFSPTTGISSACSTGAASCPTGAVAVISDGTTSEIAKFPLNARGYAEDQSLPAGGYAVTASYPGDASYGPSSTTAQFTIFSAATSTRITTAPTTAQYGASVQVTSEVTTTSDGEEPGASFRYVLDGAPLTSYAVSSTGSAYQPNQSPPAYAYKTETDRLGYTAIGTHSLTAQYPAEADYAFSASVPVTVTVTQAQPAFASVRADGAPNILVNEPTRLTAELDGSPFGSAPTGAITFYDNGALLSGTVTYTSYSGGGYPNSQLIATLPWTPTSIGTHTIKVAYPGDSHFLSAAYSTTVEVGPDFYLSASPTPATIYIASPGGSGSTNVRVDGLAGFTGTVNFSVACPIGNEMTCNLSPSSLTLSTSASFGYTTLSVSTTAAGALPPAARLQAFPPALELALLSLVCFALLLYWLAKPQRRRGAALVRFGLAFILLLSILAWTNCGGGGSHPPSNPGTPVGSYTATVTATSGSLTHSVNVTINVQ